MRPDALETKRALFWAALVAQYAGESCISASRVVASILRVDSVVQFCSSAQIDASRARAALDDPGTLSLDECERRVRADLAAKGLELGSSEHIATLQSRPFDALLQPIFDRMIERDGRIAVSPLRLLLDIIDADKALGERLAPYGLSVEKLRATLG